MNNRDDQNQDLGIPDGLRSALRRLNANRVVVPRRVDDAILRAAREHLAAITTPIEGQGTIDTREVSPPERLRKPDPRRTPIRAEWFPGILELFGGRRWATFGGVALAMVTVGVLVWVGQNPRSAARPEDLNGDGAVDMLDAFALARALQQEPRSHPPLDLNGDGLVDELDVRLLAARAVSLDFRRDS